MFFWICTTFCQCLTRSVHLWGKKVLKSYTWTYSAILSVKYPEQNFQRREKERNQGIDIWNLEIFKLNSSVQEEQFKWTHLKQRCWSKRDFMTRFENIVDRQYGGRQYVKPQTSLHYRRSVRSMLHSAVRKLCPFCAVLLFKYHKWMKYYVCHSSIRILWIHVLWVLWLLHVFWALWWVTFLRPFVDCFGPFGGSMVWGHSGGFR